MNNDPSNLVEIDADGEHVKHLGNWTTARTFDVNARRATVELDLRSPNIPEGEITLTVALASSVLTLLVVDDAIVEHSELRLEGLGRVKDRAGASASGPRRIRLTGQGRKSEVRVHRGGVAILKAMFTREYVDDVKRAHREGTVPTVR
jgi:hypothetical protein